MLLQTSIQSLQKHCTMLPFFVSVRYLLDGTKGENRTPLEQSVFDELQCTQKAYKGFSYRRVLSYPALDKILRATMNPDFFAGLPMQTAQSIVRQAVTDFKAWLAALRAYENDSSSFTGKPRMPRYCKVDRKTFKVSNQDAALYYSFFKVSWLSSHG